MIDSVRAESTGVIQVSMKIKKHIHATQNLTADEIIYSLLQILQILRGRLRDAPLPKRHAHLELIHGWTRQDRPNDFDYAR